MAIILMLRTVQYKLCKETVRIFMNANPHANRIFDDYLFYSRNILHIATVLEGETSSYNTRPGKLDAILYSSE